MIEVNIDKLSIRAHKAIISRRILVNIVTSLVLVLFGLLEQLLDFFHLQDVLLIYLIYN